MPHFDSEALGPQHRVQEVRPHEQRNDEQQHVDHRAYTFSQSRTNRNIAQKVARPSRIIARYSMNVSFSQNAYPSSMSPPLPFGLPFLIE
jgi:hypothetical protein